MLYSAKKLGLFEVCTGRVLASTIRKNIYSHAGLSSTTPAPRGVFPQALADLSSL